MPIVAGVDFGTQSVRVAIVDSVRGAIGAGVAEYPVNRDRHDPDFATQSHASHMDALALATHRALDDAKADGDDVLAIALDTTGSTVIPVDDKLEPLDDYYLWCDHRSTKEAAEITAAARAAQLPAIDRCGGVYSSEWGFSKLLHWLRNNPTKREKFASAFEHCDFVAGVLSGAKAPRAVKRSVCAMGHKWLWSESLGGFPTESFLTSVDPLLTGVRERLDGEYRTSDAIAGRLDPVWAARLGLKAGIPIPVGAFDAHWDAIGAGVIEGDVVNVIGTSTCMIGIARHADNVPGVCGVVDGSVHPRYVGVEAGLSGVGNIFEAIATRAGRHLDDLSREIESYRAGQTGLLRLTWDNGDRTVLVNAELGGVTLGWNLNHTAADELFAAIEGTALHTRIVLERMAEHGVRIDRVIHGGGVAQKNDLLNRVYANVIGKPVLVPEKSVTSLGSSIFAFLAAGVFDTIEDAQAALCPKHRVVEPELSAHQTYEELYQIFKAIYFGLGQPGSSPVALGDVLPSLRRIAATARISS
ncbi:MAG TPA: ribulokinase [Gemmatimonadaceae bacterium]|jgi:L-ribulokinase